VSNTDTALNNTRVSSVFSPVCGSRSRTGIVAVIRIALDPFTGQYPSFSHAVNPATNVAFGARQSDQQLVIERQPREPSAPTDLHPASERETPALSWNVRR
jgi:hypothetical protein